MFSQRLPAELTPSQLSSAWASARRGDVVDLTCSNPTRTGLSYPIETIEQSLARTSAMGYAPQPQGAMATREAIVRELGLKVTAAQLLLTSSTSEAYSLLFKVLCDPGDPIAVGAPSYPLVAHLAELDAVRVLTYRLAREDGFAPDVSSVEACLRQGARVVVLVSPNNPTGTCIDPSRAASVGALCARYGAALVVDEVFEPYIEAPRPSVARWARDEGAGRGCGAPLVFVLDGLSKRAALPQMKLGWVVVTGEDEALAREAMERLCWVADAYLSVSAPAQGAAPELLARVAPTMQQQIRQRLRSNREILGAALQGVAAADVLPAAGGWSAVLRVARVLSEEDLVMALLQRFGVVTHPGFFYDFESEGYLVVSLLADAASFARGVDRLAEGLGELLA